MSRYFLLLIPIIFLPILIIFGMNYNTMATTLESINQTSFTEYYFECNDDQQMLNRTANNTITFYCEDEI